MWWRPAMFLGALPALWLVALALAGRRVTRSWWVMAGGFGVSLIADLLSLWLGHPAISQVYPTAQAAVFLAVLVPLGVATRLIGLLLFISGLSLGLRQGIGLDVALHASAWGSIAVMADAMLAKGPLRTTLVWGFALLTLAWVWFWATPTFLAWGALQTVRLVMAVAWCWCAWRSLSPQVTNGR